MRPLEDTVRVSLSKVNDHKHITVEPLERPYHLLLTKHALPGVGGESRPTYFGPAGKMSPCPDPAFAADSRRGQVTANGRIVLSTSQTSM